MKIKFISPSLFKLLLALTVIVISTAILLAMQSQQVIPSRLEAQDTMEMRSLLRARNAMDDGRNTDAIKICSALLKQTPESSEGMKLLGMAYLQRGNLLSAEKNLRDAGFAAPYDPAIFRCLALTLMRQGRSDAALRELERSYALDSKSPATLHLLRDYHLKKGDRNKAALYGAKLEKLHGDTGEDGK